MGPPVHQEFPSSNRRQTFSGVRSPTPWNNENEMTIIQKIPSFSAGSAGLPELQPGGRGYDETRVRDSLSKEARFACTERGLWSLKDISCLIALVG
eukprot:2611544-Pyramimonas_sp.AAC.3